jgi:uncharacterized membrane protein
LDANSFWKYQLLVSFLMGFFFSLGAVWNSPLLIVSTLVVGVLLVFCLRRSIDEPAYDERSYVISTKASAATLRVFTISASILGGILMFLGSTSSPEVLQWGSGLVFIACTLLVLRVVFWVYYNRKYGG